MTGQAAGVAAAVSLKRHSLVSGGPSGGKGVLMGDGWLEVSILAFSLFSLCLYHDAPGP